VDINQVPGTGSGGRISLDDVKEHAKRLVASGVSAPIAEAAPATAAEALPDFSRFGEIEKQPLKAVRRKTAVHLTGA